MMTSETESKIMSGPNYNLFQLLVRSKVTKLIFVLFVCFAVYKYYSHHDSKSYLGETSQFNHKEKLEKMAQQLKEASQIQGQGFTQRKKEGEKTDIYIDDDSNEDKLKHREKTDLNTYGDSNEDKLKHEENTEPRPKHTEEKSKQVTKENIDNTVKEINVIITFSNAEGNNGLQQKFRLTVSSLLKHNSVPLAIHIIGDLKSQKIAAGIIRESYIPGRPSYRMVELDVDHLAKQLDEIVRPMQKHFSYKPGAYYSHALFFLSIAIHRVMPDTMHRVIMLDADLKFRADIKQLYDLFEDFSPTHIMGIGHDLQPVYRHTFWQYRQKNPGTRVGEPPPKGLAGFNSGVLLLDLDKMRKSQLYNSLLNAEAVRKLTEEFYFKGHLGDQDFFSLLSMKYEQLFYVLPCQWNRQLCKWWQDKGYQDVFHLYYDCPGEIKIYHGNCNTPIPED